MPRYTMPQCPEMLFAVTGVDSDNARYKAARQIAKAVNEGRLNIKIPEGFSTRQLIEITERDLMADDESKITEAVKVISKLSVARQRTQELHELALLAREQIDCLFSTKTLADEDFAAIKESLKTLENFAKANLSHKEALLQAEEALFILDEALKPAKD
jgi:hypothetical protein